MAAPTVPTLPPSPVPSDPPATFDAKAGALVPALNPFGVAVQAVGDYVETTAAEVEVNATVASAAAGLTNYQGDWLVGTPYTTGQSVRNDGRFWFALAGSTGVTPVEGATWTEIIRIPTPVEDGQALVGSGAGLIYTPLGRSAQAGEYLIEDRYLASDTFTVPATVTKLRVYAVGGGGDATTGASGSGGGMAFGTITVTPGEELDLDITAGVATVSRGMTALFTANGAADSVGSTPGAPGTASIDGIVTDGAAYTGGNGAAAANRGGASAASPLGNGVDAGASAGGAGIGGVGSGSAGGGVGGAAISNSSGGSGSAATGSGRPGLGRSRLALFADPLLRKCIAAGASAAQSNIGFQPGPGAGAPGTTSVSADGGFGGGGNAPSGVKGGNGGELGGGGSGGATGGGDGGIGGGGASSSNPTGLGGPAAIWLFY